MKFSLHILGHDFGFAIGKSALSPELAAWTRAEDVNPNAEGAKLTSPYVQSAWVYIAVSRLAEKIAQIPFRISRCDCAPGRGRARRRAMAGEIVETGECVDLFRHPHPTMPRQLFWEMVVTWIALRGEAFILPLDAADQPVDLTARNPRVQRLITLPTELFWHVVTGYELAAWRYTGSPLISPIPSEMLLPGEVIHTRSPNPYLYWRGMSPLLVAMLAAGADYAAAQYAKGYWMNNADTGLIVSTDQSPSEPQRAAILASLRERKRKAGTADRPLFLWGGTKVEKPVLSGMEAQFIANRQMNRQEIGAIFKVPESVMGFSSDKTSALSGGGQAINAEQVQFVESTIATLCAQLEDALAPVVRSFGEDLVGWFDLESLPIMQAARMGRLDAAGKAFAIGAAFNDINALYDLGFPDYAWGKKGYLPFGLQPAGEMMEMPGEEDADEEADAETEEDAETEGPEDAEKSNPFARMAKLLHASRLTSHASRSSTLLWQAHVRARLKTVKVMHAKVSKVLWEARTAALAKLNEIHQEKSSAVGLPANQRSLVDLIFDAEKFGLKLVTTLETPLKATLQTAGKELLREMGKDDAWKMAPQQVLDYVAGRQQSIKDVGGTVRERINTTLQAGLDAGETTAELAARVKDTFNKLSNGGEEMTTPEALRVARTETNMAYGASRQIALEDAGVEYKSWLSSHGPNVRDGHADAEDTYSDAPIPVGEPFEVANKDGVLERMMFPGDDSLGASAGNIINCQCIQLAALKEGEDEKSVTFNIIGLGQRTFAKPCA